MHSLYFVLISKQDAENSQETRHRAMSELDNNNFASESNGYFGSSEADWYVIGGRWSGELSKLTMKKDFMKEVYKLYPNKNKATNKYIFYDVDAVKKNEKGIQKLWQDMGGKGINLVSRNNQYDQTGADNDAMKITPKILKGLQRKEYKDVEVFDAENCDEYHARDLEQSTIGDWLVVVDYHF